MTDTLWQSFANAIAAAGEAGAVQSAIEQALKDGGAAGVRAGDDEWNYVIWSDEEEWILSYSVQSIRIRRATAPATALGTLSVALSFYRPEDRSGEGWEGGRRAKVYVGVAPTKKAWDDDSLLLDGSGASELAEPRGGRRWWRKDSPNAWFFCVALDAVDSREALVREVMRPLGALLAGADEDVAFEGCTATLAPPPAV